MPARTQSQPISRKETERRPKPARAHSRPAGSQPATNGSVGGRPRRPAAGAAADPRRPRPAQPHGRPPQRHGPPPKGGRTGRPRGGRGDRGAEKGRRGCRPKAALGGCGGRSRPPRGEGGKRRADGQGGHWARAPRAQRNTTRQPHQGHGREGYPRGSVGGRLAELTPVILYGGGGLHAIKGGMG